MKCKKFSVDVRNHIQDWLGTEEGKEYKFNKEIATLPDLFDKLNEIRLKNIITSVKAYLKK